MAQIVAEQFLIERAPGFLCHPRVGVGVDQAGQEPAFADQFRAADRIGRPTVAIGIQVDGLTAGQRMPPDPQDRHVRAAYKAKGPAPGGPGHMLTPPRG